MTQRMLDEQIAVFIRDRNTALIELDLQWARSMMSHEVSDFTLLAAMHKARYNIPAIPERLRHESGEWLRENNMGDLYDLPLLPPGELPQGVPEGLRA